MGRHVIYFILLVETYEYGNDEINLMGDIDKRLSFCLKLSIHSLQS